MTAAMPQPISMTTRPAKKLWAIMDPPMNRDRDRKSTRLNSSHTVISYAVFCLKKKKKHRQRQRLDQALHHHPSIPQECHAKLWRRHADLHTLRQPTLQSNAASLTTVEHFQHTP